MHCHLLQTFSVYTVHVATALTAFDLSLLVLNVDDSLSLGCFEYMVYVLHVRIYDVKTKCMDCLHWIV